MNPMIFGYKEKTEGGRLLARTFGGDFSWPGSANKPERKQIVINWGSGDGADWMRYVHVINDPVAICNSVLKNNTFSLLKKAKCKIPEYTMNAKEAAEWINAGTVVFGRMVLDGKAGKGIRVFNGDRKEQVRTESLWDFKMFTKYFPAKWEFKVHVAFGKAWLVWEVKKDNDFDEHGKYIRNYANNYVFKNEYRKLHPAILKDCERACKALGLDFAVFDVGVGEKQGQWCIYESNTAPAMDEADARKYVKMFKENLKLK